MFDHFEENCMLNSYYFQAYFSLVKCRVYLIYDPQKDLDMIHKKKTGIQVRETHPEILS